MKHIRTYIRDRVITDLTGLTTTGSNIFPSREYPLTSAQLPGLCVFTVEEDAESQSMRGSTIRTLTLAIHAYVEAIDGSIDDTLDTIANEIESVLANDRHIGDFAINSYLDSAEIEFNKEGKKPIGIMKMEFMIEYLSNGYLFTQEEDFLTSQAGKKFLI